MKGEIYMKKTYAKPGLESRTFAQFENVFTACNKGNFHAQGCEWHNDQNPGVGSKPCDVCGEYNSEHAEFAAPAGVGS